MRRVPLLLSHALPLLLASAPALARSAPLQDDAEPVPFLGSQAAEVDAFLQEVLAMRNVHSVGVLPIYLYDDEHREEPWVPRLGVSLGDLISERLRSADAAAAGDDPARLNVLAPAPMKRRLNRVRVDSRWLYDGEAIEASSDRLGVDVLIFGNASLEDSEDPRRRWDKNLVVSLWAYGFVNPASADIAARSFTLEQGAAGQDAAFVPNQLTRPSSWRPRPEAEGSRPEAQGSRAARFDQEYELVLEFAALRAFEQVELHGEDRRVYVAPADTSGLVEAVNVLRTSQAAYLNAVEETRLRMRQGNNEPVEVVINGRTFEGTQAAFTHLFQLANSLEEEPAVRFGRSLAVDLIKEIQPMINPREHVLDLADVGFTAQSNIELIIDQELATGGLARNEYARDLLHEHGFSTVVAPRLESYAGAYRLYVTVYDLERKRIANTSSMRFDEEFTPEIRERLGLE